MPAALRFLLASIVILALASSSFAAAQAQDVVVDKIVAQVNGEMITLLDLNDRVKLYVTQVLKKPYNPSDPDIKDLQKSILTTMIEDILLRQEAKRLKISISDTEVEARIKELKAKGGNLTEAQFVQQLRLEGLTRKQFVDDMRKDMLKKELLGYMVQRKVLVSEDEIKAYYDANKGSFHAQSGQRIGLIMVNKVEEAKSLRQRIAGGQISFADAARKFSVGPGADQGGDLGKVDPKDLAPELRAALQGVQPGGVSEPVMLDGKPVLLTILAATGQEAKASQAEGPTLASAHDEIYEKIYREKLEKQFADYMDRLRAKSVIKINL